MRSVNYRPSGSASMPCLNRHAASSSRTNSPLPGLHAGHAGHRPSTSCVSNWKTFDDESGCGDIAAAMAAVNRAMKNKNMAKEAGELQSSFEEADRHMAQEDKEFETLEAGEFAKQQVEEERLARKLRAAIKKGSLKTLKKVIDEASASGVSIELLNEAKAFLRLESHLQMALATANLDDVRKVVEEVDHGKALASFPQRSPYALHQRLQYFSERKDDWVDCRVTDVSADDRIKISLKKKASHWYSLSEQEDKFRVADADIIAAAPLVRLDDARALLDRAEALELATLSQDIEKIQAAIAQAEHEKALRVLVSRAHICMQEALRDRADAEMSRRSSAAHAWHAAKSELLLCLQDEADQVCSEKRPQTTEGGRGLGNLEKDLAIERTRVSFESTSFCALKMAIEQLASEDLEVPAEVIEELRDALLQIAEKHEELEEAIRKGDLDAITLALEQAPEHFVPEPLASKARSAVDMAAALGVAIESRDPQQLASTLARAESGDFAEMLFFQRAHSILAATTNLQEATCSCNVDAIRAAFELVSEQFLPEELVNKARMAMMLDKAIKSNDLALLESTLTLAERECVEMPFVLQSRKVLRTCEAVQAAIATGELEAIKRTLSNAMVDDVLSEMSAVQQALAIVSVTDALEMSSDSYDADSLEKAIRAAEAVGAPALYLHDARCELEEKRKQMATETLHAAMEVGGDLEAMAEAIQAAETYGVPMELLEKAQKDFGARAVEAAMSGNDVDAIEDAISTAEAYGVSAELVDKFRQQLEADRLQKEELKRLQEAQQAREEFLESLKSLEADNVPDMRAAIAQGEALGFEDELVPVRKALEDELARRLAKAKEERTKHEKIFAEFKCAKEAQEFGGSVVSAQWRAAAAEVAVPLTISED